LSVTCDRLVVSLGILFFFKISKTDLFSYFLFCFCLTKYQIYSNLASWLDCIRLIEINIKSKPLSLLKDTTCNLYNISIPIYLNYPQNGPQDIRSRPSIVNQGNSQKKTSPQWTMLWLLQGWGYGLLCLTSLSTLFQLYCRGQFYWGGIIDRVSKFVYKKAMLYNNIICNKKIT
jgi:hypothetical protein